MNEAEANNGAGPFVNFNTTYDITDAVSKVWNQHTFKFGLYMQKSVKDQTSFGAFDGTYNFGDNSNNPYDTGFGFSNAATGVYNTFSQAANMINGQYRYWNIEFYAQDLFKAKMVEQLSQIEHYRNRLWVEEGRIIDGEQAAQEWIARYAKEFAEAFQGSR